MKISATIDNNEYDFDVNATNQPEEFICSIIGEPEKSELIKFRYSDGVISNLTVKNIIQTESGIILERLINAFREYNDSHQMGFEPESLENDLDEIKPYDPEEIRVRSVFFSAFQIHNDIKRNKIDLNPEFQRNFVWNDGQKSLLIESMLLKIPLPAFYFAEDKRGRFQVVDGLQRLTVINQYLNNQFKLKNLQYLHHLEGKYFSVDPEKKITEKNALEEPYDSRIEGTQLNINVIEASSPLRVKYDIFYRINTGGRPLNRQEIRNCFATDKTRRLLKQMATNDLFNSATGNSVKDTRMDAQELALRFCGFYFYRSEYFGEMNGFLDEVLERLNEQSDLVLANIQKKYYSALQNAIHLFDGFAFRKILPEHLSPNARRQFLNKAMFIVWTVLLASTPTEQIVKFPKGEFAIAFANELQNNPLLFNSLTTGTTDRYNLDYLFESFTRILDNYLNGL